MELKEFISESIKQITDGLIEGHEYVQLKSPGSEGVQNGYRRISSTLGCNLVKEIKTILVVK